MPLPDLCPDDLRLIARLHGGFPLSDRPFADLAAEFGWREDTSSSGCAACSARAC
jgi:hypothetical protein